MNVDINLLKTIVDWLDQQHKNHTIDTITHSINHEVGEAYTLYHLLHDGLAGHDTLRYLNFPFDTIKQIDKQIKHMFNLPEDLPGEEMAGLLLSVSRGSHKVHVHTDPVPNELLHHVRFNIMLRKPEAGGNPIMDGVEYDIPEFHTWVCEASNVEHATSLIPKSNIEYPRILLSAGYCLTDEQLIQVRKTVLQNNSPVCFKEITDQLRRPEYEALPEEQAILWEKEQFNRDIDPDKYMQTYQPSDADEDGISIPMHMMHRMVNNEIHDTI